MIGSDKFQWMDQAACKNHPTHIFYPEPGSLNTPNTRLALSICNDCPVRNNCLDHAITNREPGIWGGQTEQQRRIGRRRHFRPNQLVEHGWHYERAATGAKSQTHPHD